MSLIVQKFGGSSVSDAESIKRVAKRIVETRKAGNDVVVAVSAMGDTTDELLHDQAHVGAPEVDCGRGGVHPAPEGPSYGGPYAAPAM